MTGRISSKTSKAVYDAVLRNIESVIIGQTDTIRKLLAAFVSGGHVLLEDYPGTGKTTLAKTIARTIDCTYKRIQFTPDLLPSDILGISIFDANEKRFRFHQGPIFTNILLADEINRASPRTQSALLEAMAESQVSIDGRRHELEDLFFVIATQNPVESRGTYPLPEAQMDRFTARLSLGYVTPEQEVAILSAFAENGNNALNQQFIPAATIDEIILLKRAAQNIRISDELKHYIVEIVHKTRAHEGLELGASPRASLALMKNAQALALFDGMEFVTPEHVREMAVPIIAHRLLISPQARFSGQTEAGIVAEILEAVAVPA